MANLEFNGARNFLGSPLRLFLVSHRNSSAITHESYYGIGRTGGGREKRDLHPWFAAEIQNGNTVDLTLKTATPWFNHPMGPTGRGYKQFYAPLMETPSLGCLLGEIEPKWHHVLTQAITRSSGQDTLEKFLLDSRACQQRYPPIKNTRTFITWKGSPRNYGIASKKRNRIFAARQTNNRHWNG